MFAPGGDADPAHLRGERVRDVVPVQIHRRDYIVLRGPREDLLKERVGDHILDDDSTRGPAPGAAAELPRPELVLREFVAPVAETALGELHDVPLVDQRDAAGSPVAGVADRGADEPLRPFPRDRLHPEGTRVRETDRRDAHLVAQEGAQTAGLLTAGFPLDAGVDVLGVLAEDRHVDEVGLANRRRDTLEPAHRADAREQVQLLAQRHVERPDPATHGRREGSLDRDPVMPDRAESVPGEPVPGAIERLLTGEHLEPRDPPFAAVGLLDGRFEDRARGAPDVGTDPVSFDEGE